MTTLTLRITGLTEETLRKIDEKAGRRGRDRAEYVRDLIERDLGSRDSDDPRSILQRFEPVQAEFAASGLSEGDLDLLIEEAREQVSRHSGTSSGG